MRQPQARRHLVKHINIVIRPPKHLLARPHRIHRYVRQRVHPLRLIRRQRSIHNESVGVIGRRHIVVAGPAPGNGRGRCPRPGFVDGVRLAPVWAGAHPGGDDVARVPILREVRARVVADTRLRDGVLREPGVLVHADGVPLGTVVFLGAEVLCVGASEYV